MERGKGNMKKRILSIVLTISLIVTSLTLTTYAVEVEDGMYAEAQEEVTETSAEADQTKGSNVTEEIKTEESRELTESDEGIETTEWVQSEIMTESTDEQASEIISTQLEEETNEIENIPKEEESTQANGETLMEEETQEITEEIGAIEEIIVESSSGLNEAVRQKILSLKSRYPQGTNWDPNNVGWRGLAWECYGFVITMEGLVFKDYPTQH